MQSANPKILHIDTSTRQFDESREKHNSLSRKLANRFKKQWLTLQPKTEFIYRDLAISPPDFIDQAWIEAVFTPEAQRTEAQNAKVTLSNTLIDELIAADIILLSTPMYNYGMPAVLKAWFDQVIRVNKTFSFDPERGDFPLEPCLSGKTMVLLTSSGEFGFEAGGMRESMNHLGPHIKTLSHYLGVESVYEIGSEYQEFGDERHTESVSKAEEETVKLASQLVKTVFV